MSEVPCPHCGESIRKNAKACPHCGSDESTGWASNTYLDGIDLPDDDSYEELREKEFGGARNRIAQKRWVIVVAAIVMGVMLAGVVAVLRC